MLPKIDRLRKQAPDLNDDTTSMFLIALCLLDPVGAIARFRSGKPEDWEAAAFDLAQKIPLAEVKKLSAWIAQNMEQLNAGADEPAAPEVTEKKSGTAESPTT
jgi:hypothetical protein